MIKLCIFDFDGTLVDTEPLFTIAWQQISSRYGKYFTDDIKNTLLGYKAITAVERGLKALGIDANPHEILAEIDSIYRKLINTDAVLLPGVSDTLALMNTLGIHKAIATSGHRAWVNQILANCGITPEFEFIISAEDVTIGKPDPEPFSLVIDHFGFPPKQCIAIEDSPHGIRSAHGSGAISIAIPSETTKGMDFNKADYIFDSITNIDETFLRNLK